MKHNCMGHFGKRRFIACTLALFSVIALVNVQAALVTLDLSGIPDGTPVSANNPYSGVVNFQGRADYEFMGFEPFYPVTVLSKEHGYIQSSAIWMKFDISAAPEPPPGTQTDFRTQRVTALLTATFLQPVTDVTFTTEIAAYGVTYGYEGVNQDGSPFSGSGRASEGSIQPLIRFDGNPHTMNLAAPDGGYFTKLELHNWSYGGGAPNFQVYDIAVRTVGVPEPSNWMDRAFLLLLVAVAPFVRRKGKGALAPPAPLAGFQPIPS